MIEVATGALDMNLIGRVVVLYVWFFKPSEPPHHIEDFVLFDFNPKFKPLPDIDDTTKLLDLGIDFLPLFVEILLNKSFQLFPSHAQLFLE
jgi:hypothetical protein